MKLSVLLPTRNGAAFLPAALDAVLSQDADLELVVSDNANTDGTRELLEASRNPRLRVVRHDTAVPVTENWTSALEASTGEYLLMLGDDDLLLPGGAQRILELLEEGGQPDCLLMNAFSYVFPSAVAGVGTSQYGDPHFHFGPEFAPYRDVPPALRNSLVRDMLRFRVRLPLNMQTTVFARRATRAIRGEVFPPPFPDHYALNSMLLTARRWWFAPEQLVVIGVTPKSFGHYVYSDKQAAGLEYLGISADFPGRVPGSTLVDAMHMWLQMLLDAYPDLLPGARISRGDYLARQLWAWVVGWRSGALTLGDAVRMLRGLSGPDVRVLLAAIATEPRQLARAASRLRPGRSEAETRWPGLQPLPGVDDIAAFGRWVTGPAKA